MDLREDFPLAAAGQLLHTTHSSSGIGMVAVCSPKVADLYDIAPWVCQALDNPKPDRVGHQSNDGDGSRSGLEVQHHAGRNRDDQIRRVTLDHDILSFDITKAAQFLEK